MKKKSHKARNAYFIFLVVLAVLILLFLMYCRKSLILYEEAQPEYVMDSYIQELKENGLSKEDIANLTFSDKNPEIAYLQEMNQLLANSALSYHKLRENFSDGALIYGIYAEDTKLAEVSLMPESSYNRMYILTITDWSAANLQMVPYRLEYRAEITIPADYEVTINGAKPTEDMLVSSKEDSTLDYCRAYVDIPTLVSYDTGYYSHPLNIIVKDNFGEEVFSSEQDKYNYGEKVTSSELDTKDNKELLSSSENEAQHTASLLSTSTKELENTLTTVSFGYATPDMPDDLEQMVLEKVQRYSKFFSKDLPGGLESIDPIRDLFPEDSIYLTLAEQYRREDIHVFSSHTNTHFENEKISEYTIYSKDCFSCRVYFDKSMSLGSREMIDTTDNVYYFVKLKDNWVIADIK